MKITALQCLHKHQTPYRYTPVHMYLHMYTLVVFDPTIFWYSFVDDDHNTTPPVCTFYHVFMLLSNNTFELYERLSLVYMRHTKL
jgi:hypothetical protein